MRLGVFLVNLGVGADFDEFDEFGVCVCCVFVAFRGAFDEFGGVSDEFVRGFGPRAWR